MMTLLLMIHLGGAGLLAVVLGRALFTTHYIRYAKLIGINTAAQFASGSLLAVVGQNMGFGRLCLNISIYLVIILFVEGIVLSRAVIQQQSIQA